MNKQLFANSPLASQAREACAESADHTDSSKLFAEKDPNLAILHEKPEHRTILWMKARGHSNRECAHATGYTDAWVSQITRQPWFRTLLLKAMNDLGADGVDALLKGAAADSVLKLIEHRDKAPAAVSKSACDSLLDRFLGKPAQKVETTLVTSPSAETVEELNAEITRLEEQERTVFHRN